MSDFAQGIFVGVSITLVLSFVALILAILAVRKK